LQDGKRLKAATNRATVLVADDEEDVREVAAAQLEALGYRVVQAASGRVALDLLSGGSGVDLLMIDYAMPSMSGIELARAVRAKCPDLPILLVTGYVDAEHIEARGPYEWLLKKPYRMAEFAGAVEALLRRAGSRTGGTNVVPLRSSQD
jgi:CheY-like chemotaxis protein